MFGLPMSTITIGVGVVLTAIGVWGYWITGKEHITALIPAFFGIAFVLLGQFARDDKFRKHAMHIAAALGLIGLVVPLARLIPAMQRDDFAWNEAVTAQLSMAIFCGLFVVACVKSFIDARRARKQAEPTIK